MPTILRTEERDGEWRIWIGGCLTHHRFPNEDAAEGFAYGYEARSNEIAHELRKKAEDIEDVLNASSVPVPKQ